MRIRAASFILMNCFFQSLLGAVRVEENIGF